MTMQNSKLNDFKERFKQRLYDFTLKGKNNFTHAPAPNHEGFRAVRGFAPRETPKKKVPRLPQWDTPRGVPLSHGAPHFNMSSGISLTFGRKFRGAV